MDEKTLRLRSLRLAKEAAEKNARKRNAEIRSAAAIRQLDALLQRLIDTIKHGNIEDVNRGLVAATYLARRTTR